MVQWVGSCRFCDVFIGFSFIKCSDREIGEAIFLWKNWVKIIKWKRRVFLGQGYQAAGKQLLCFLLNLIQKSDILRQSRDIAIFYKFYFVMFQKKTQIQPNTPNKPTCRQMENQKKLFNNIAKGIEKRVHYSFSFHFTILT